MSAYLLTLPSAIGLFFFILLPVIQTVWISLYDYNLLSGNSQWVGLENYDTIFKDPILKLTLKNTFTLFLMKVPIQMMLGLGLALLVRQPSGKNSILRTAIMIPCVTSMVVVTTIWGLMYHPSDGLFNSILETLQLSPQPFLVNPKQAMPSIVAMLIWKDVGYNMIFFLAGLKAVPPTFYEAAKLDGANKWQLFRDITFPLIRRTTLFVLFINTILTFNTFAPIYLTTHGGPSNATRVIVLYIFDLAFRYNRFSIAATISVILGAILLTINVIQQGIGSKLEY